jgi:hypothetical protein
MSEGCFSKRGVKEPYARGNDTVTVLDGVDEPPFIIGSYARIRRAGRRTRLHKDGECRQAGAWRSVARVNGGMEKREPSGEPDTDFLDVCRFSILPARDDERYREKAVIGYGASKSAL